MSGTSMDGADAALVDFAAQTPRVLGFASMPFSRDLQQALMALNQAGENEIERARLAGHALADVYAEAAAQAMAAAQIDPHRVRAIGCHGQTVRHRPDLGFSVQLNDAACLAERTGIDVITDFRARDIAAGGEGAPLAPAFHDGVFRDAGETRAVVNIGGIANLTLLSPRHPVWGFDCGPGNCLMDFWMARHRGMPFDHHGEWAAGGNPDPGLLGSLQSEAYFARPAPKSTGRDLFNPDWLAARIGTVAPVDVQATLLELSAWCIADHLLRHAAETRTLIVCGGGARNARLMARLQARLPTVSLRSSEDFGIPPQQVESIAFAWLARQCIERSAIDLTRTTGARGPRILGCLTPA